MKKSLFYCLITFAISLAVTNIPKECKIDQLSPEEEKLIVQHIFENGFITHDECRQVFYINVIFSPTKLTTISTNLKEDYNPCLKHYRNH